MTAASGEACVHPEPLRAWTAPRSRLWLVILGLIIIIRMPYLILAFWPPRGMVSDFFQDWASARNVLDGLPVYTEHTETIPRYLGERDPVSRCVLVNAHPPTSVLLLLPFSKLDYRPALLVWNLAGLAMLGVSLWIIRRQLDISLPAWPIFSFLTLFFICLPLLQQLANGQWNLVLLLLVTAAWAAERSGRRMWAGALVSVATAIKVFPGFLFLYFILRRQWSALVAGALTLVVLTGLTAAILGPQIYPTYIRDVLPRLEKHRTSWSNASLVGFWIKLFNPATREERVEPLWRSAAAARAGILVSWLAVASLATWSVRRASTRVQLDHAFAVAVTGMLLLSPTAWQHYFLLLLLPFAVLWVDPPRSRAAKVLLIAAVAALWLWEQPLYFIIPGAIIQGMAAPIHTFTLLSYHCYSLVAILVLNAARAGAGSCQEGT